MKVISASEANRQFSKLLRDVSHGATITVVSRGQAVCEHCSGKNRHRPSATPHETSLWSGPRPESGGKTHVVEK
jgi:antitoxin (DNA-binding transcriptional repressor) of toxin-antitoxin stability system